jgi:putative tricarboxylic transport membrane protein
MTKARRDVPADLDGSPAGRAEPTPGTDVPGSTAKGPNPWAALLPEVILLALCAFLWPYTNEWESTAGGPGPAAYPRLLLILLAAAMIIRLVQDVWKIRSGALDDPAPDAEDMQEEGAEFERTLMSGRRLAIIVALSVAYVVGTMYVGWVLATFFTVVVFLYLAGKRNLLFTIPFGVVVAVGMAYVFVKIVYIPLPTGEGVFDDFSVFLFELIGAY